MQEDKREKVRLASDLIFKWPKAPWPKREEIETHAEEAQKLERELELFRATERARLTVLNLTDRDKRFLRAMKIAY